MSAAAIDTRFSVEEIRFDVKTFLNISVVRGRFGHVGGFYEVTPAGARLELVADARSIDTGDPLQDDQLRSLAGFDLDAYPQVRFSSTTVRQLGDGKLHVEGRAEAGGKLAPVQLEARMRRFDGGLELDGSRKVTEPLPATVYVTVRLRDAG